jgi:hypothetical protein
MSKLLVIDRVNYVLEGQLEKIKPQERTILDEENITTAIKQYKNDYVDQGLALGELNEGFLLIPTKIEYGDKIVEGEQVAEEEKEPAFMIIDVYWNSEAKEICGKLIILDTEDGDKIKAAIDKGTDCFISASETEIYTVMEKEQIGRAHV